MLVHIFCKFYYKISDYTHTRADSCAHPAVPLKLHGYMSGHI